MEEKIYLQPGMRVQLRQDIANKPIMVVKGKVTNPNTKHDMNLHRMDWNYEFKLGYYHANTCTVEHYRNSGKEELMREFNDLDEE